MSIITNIKQPAPVWFRKLKRGVNMALLPATVITLKSLWHGSDKALNEVLVICTVSLPALLEFIGMLLPGTDTDTSDSQPYSAPGDNEISKP